METASPPRLPTTTAAARCCPSTSRPGPLPVTALKRTTSSIVPLPCMAELAKILFAAPRGPRTPAPGGNQPSAKGFSASGISSPRPRASASGTGRSTARSTTRVLRTAQGTMVLRRVYGRAGVPTVVTPNGLYRPGSPGYVSGGLGAAAAPNGIPKNRRGGLRGPSQTSLRRP